MLLKIKKLKCYYLTKFLLIVKKQQR
jgi:hypothetical protein